MTALRIMQTLAWLLALAGLIALVYGSLQPGGWVPCSAPDVCDSHPGSDSVTLGLLGTIIGGVTGILLSLAKRRLGR
jgi:hypothetical protein